MQYRIGQTLTKGIITSALLMLLMASSSASAVSHGPLVLTLTGAVTDAGTQTYAQSGGLLLGGQIGAYTLDPNTAQLTYSMNAVVQGLTASGAAQFSLTANGFDSNSISHSIVATGAAVIGDTIPAIELPLGCAGAACTSEVPAFLVGMAQIDLTVDGVAQPSLTTPFIFESAYLNPYGGPIIMGTPDLTSIALVATYTTGTIQWSNSATAGTISGTISTKHDFTGQFSVVAQESEDLVAGTATDSGTVKFFNMNNVQYNAEGTYSGTSFIPSGGSACTGIPLPPGTCAQTGFQSTGVYNLKTDMGRSITGTYDTAWDTPAITYTSTVTAALSK